MSHQHKSEEGFDLTLTCDVTSLHEVYVVVQTLHGVDDNRIAAESVTPMPRVITDDWRIEAIEARNADQ